LHLCQSTRSSSRNTKDLTQFNRSYIFTRAPARLVGWLDPNTEKP
ncbi:28743_t:CDS:2, partial [Racocetra persica]